jgi:cyclohexadieny/prephenate dehydrogenase
MSQVHVGRLALIGLGHIGSSIARAAQARGLVDEIVGHARSLETRTRAMELGFVDRVTETPGEAADCADLVIICSPLSTYRAIGEAIAPHLKPGAIVSDVGSAKSCVITDLAPSLPDGVHLVPGHPLAGTEHSGPEAGFAELFDGRYCVITPVAGVDQAATEWVADFWRALGSTVEFLAPEHHDRVLAITSHVPHLIAYTIVGTATDLSEDIKEEVIRYAASGFRDFTRIAGSNPVMWRDVFLANKEATLEMLQRFTEDLTALQRAIRKGDAEMLEKRFSETRAIRRGVIMARQDDMPRPGGAVRPSEGN